MSNVATQQELGLSNLSVADSPDTSQVLLLQSTENVEGDFELNCKMMNMLINIYLSSATV
jgi:hypothetical protein